MQNCRHLVLMAFFVILGPLLAYAETDSSAEDKSAPLSVPGVTAKEILLGSILPLDGRAAGLGLGMRAGIEKALAGQSIGERRVRVLYADDLYEPILTPLKVRRLLKRGVFAMLGNVGTPTAAASLPILKQNGVPAVGFLTGAGLLRTGQGPVLNYRASYAQETAAVIDAAIKAGIKPEQICAYVQNDAYGKAGLLGMQKALQRANAPKKVLQGLETLLANSTAYWLVQQAKNETPINKNGPVGVYVRNRLETLAGYQALKNWERKTGYRCKVVLAVGVYGNVAQFIHRVRDTHKENWIISAVSFVGAADLLRTLKELNAYENLDIKEGLRNVLMSQVVPPLNSELAIVREARNRLGKEFGFVSLEGYIVGQVMLELLRETPMPLTRMAFMNQAKKARFDLGGIPIDFTQNGYQGSNLITITRMTTDGYQPITTQDWRKMLAWRPQTTQRTKTPQSAPATTSTRRSNRTSTSRRSRSRSRSRKSKRRNKGRGR